MMLQTVTFVFFLYLAFRGESPSHLAFGCIFVVPLYNGTFNHRCCNNLDTLIDKFQ